jgi:hypothetical protein
MKLKSWNSKQIKYGFVKKLLAMNYFLIIILHKEANFLTLDHQI